MVWKSEGYSLIISFIKLDLNKGNDRQYQDRSGKGRRNLRKGVNSC